MVRKEHIYLCVHEKSFSYPIEHKNIFFSELSINNPLLARFQSQY